MQYNLCYLTSFILLNIYQLFIYFRIKGLDAMAEAVQVVTSCKLLPPSSSSPGRSNGHDAATFYRLGMLYPFDADKLKESNDQNHQSYSSDIDPKAKYNKSIKIKKKSSNNLTETKIDFMTSPSVTYLYPIVLCYLMRILLSPYTQKLHVFRLQ
jgi:hypothetical protein